MGFKGLVVLRNSEIEANGRGFHFIQGVIEALSPKPKWFNPGC